MLNPSLFALLEKRFGEGNVKIANENQEMIGGYRVDPLGSLTNLNYRLQIETPGEEYLVRCPFCNDWKHRLYINHMWGEFDTTANSKNIWLAHCWNEDCLQDYNNRMALHDQVLEYYQIGPRSYSTGPIVRSVHSAVKQRPRKMELPGIVWQLDDMKRRSPKHDALKYIEDRLFDPTYLGERYEVGYCLDSYYENARNRIIAPIRYEGKLVGWQARYLGDPPKGVMKWYTCPGCPTGSYLYNYDEMRKHQTKVITEGPGDVWGFGPQACACFTKSMSAEQKRLFLDCFRPDDVAVVMLDPVQDLKTRLRGELHHIEKLYLELEQEPKLRGRVIKVYLPGGHDPAEMDRDYMRSLIRLHAEEKGLYTSFGKPKETTHVSIESV
jgi:hypothetical protein